ncbi:MAG TPA: hypothetical protein VMA75_04900 [Candidatus Paceibacterota bacterium]|nr:hypothetical protein [Candidatus Paceibacterota bacterium]
MQTLYLLLVIGLFFGSLGAIMAYLITYKEWEHHYSSKKIPRRMALETALFTLAFFLAITLVLALFFR